MKLLACISGGMLSEALLRQCVKDGHSVSAFWVELGSQRSPAELCKSLGVALIQLDHKIFARGLETADGTRLFPGRNLFIMSMAISYAVAHGYDGIAVGFCGRPHDAKYPDTGSTFLSMVDALMDIATGKRLILVQPFQNWPREDVEKLVEKPKVTKAVPVPLEEVEGNPDLPEVSLEVPEEVLEMPLKASVEAEPYRTGHLRPFIFTSEEAYGYVNDKPSFDAVANQYGSVKNLLEARMDGPDGDAPTFKPDGQGVSLAEWLGPALGTLVDTSMMTLGSAPGHNPGHQGCC